MSDKVYQMTAAGPAKMTGWHSWRHRTRDAQDAARADYLARSGRAARRERARQRQGKSR